MTRAWMKLPVAAVLVIYPIAIYFADGYLTPSELVAGLLLLLSGRVLITTRINPVKQKQGIALAALLPVAAVAVLLFMPDINLAYLRLYPMLFNLSIFAIFFGSLFTSMPLVERIARMMHTDLPPQGVIYTRHVTWVWCGVLLLNAALSLYTAIGASFEVWSLYNGVIVYFLFGSVFVGEYLVRTRLRRKWAAA
jgi:uncharacterized membrane protein